MNRPNFRVAVIGAGPGGLAAAKYALEAGFAPTVFEASDDLGGQWNTAADHSGIWPGLRTNTSRAMTAFSDFAAPSHHPLHPAATQIHDYLRAYAEHFGVAEHIRLSTEVARVSQGWVVDGESFDAVVLATGRFRRPQVPPVVGSFAGEVLHAFDYPGGKAFAGRSVLVYGNGVSGLEIATDLAGSGASEVTSAFRKPRYVIEKDTDGVSSDWRWYTHANALERRHLPADVVAQRLRDRIVRVAGHPADFGAPAPDPDLRVAGVSLCQGYLRAVADGAISCRSEIMAIDGHGVEFADGSSAHVDVIVVATGYDEDLPYLDNELVRILGSPLRLYRNTLHPDLPTLGVIGQFLMQGPYFPVLELQARWVIGVLAGTVERPPAEHMRAVMQQPRPAIESHNLLALTLAEEQGVAPDLDAWPDLAEPLLFGPMLPVRYRLDGPGSLPDAAARFRELLVSSPRDAVDADGIAILREVGLSHVADRLSIPPGIARPR